MDTFDDPLALFRVAVERLNAEDFRGAAQCCDPVSLRAFQRETISRFAQAGARRPLPTSMGIARRDSVPAKVCWSARRRSCSARPRRDVRPGSW